MVESRASLGTLIGFQLPLENGTLCGRRVALSVWPHLLLLDANLPGSPVVKQPVPGPAQTVQSQGHGCREHSAVTMAQARRGRFWGCTVRDSCRYLLVTSANALPGARVHGAACLGQDYRQNTNLSL